MAIFTADRMKAANTAYFDGSGTKQMKAMVFAGFVSKTKKWSKFTVEWEKVLKRENVSALHMTDFVSSEGEFKSWKNDKDRRKHFISDLVGCIKRHTHKGFSSGIYIKAYDDVNRDFMLAEKLGQPYTICGYSCAGALELWSIDKDIKKSEILIVVEDGDQDQNEFLTLVRAKGFKALPAPKSYSCAFQAADLIGWKCRTVLQEVLVKDPKTGEEAHDIMRTLDALKGAVQSNKAWDLESLCRLCVEKEFPKRDQTLAGTP